MELKDRFANHKVEPDQEAWEHFSFLRKHKKRKRRFLLWAFRGSAILGVGLAVGIFFWQKNNQSIISNNTVVSESTTKKQVEENVSQTNIITNGDPGLNEELKENDNNKLTSDELQTNKGETTAKNNRKLLDEPLNTGNQIDQTLVENALVIDNSTFLKSEQQNDEKQVPPTIIKKEEKSENEKAVAINAAVQISALPSFSMLVAMEDSRKTDRLPALAFDSLFLNLEKRPMNILKLTGGYTDGYIQGFSLENNVNKIGFGVNLAYRRDLGRLIGVGLSTGYWQGVDMANPTLENRDSEEIKYLHANLYLYLVNAYKHRLLVKVGGGLTSTKRYLGTFFLDTVTNTLERRFQFSNVTDFGFLVEGAYEYHISSKWMVGTSFSLLQHNEGGWLAGLSLGYNF